MSAGIFPASFWPLALAHLLALLCPGPDFLLIVSHSARHGLRGGVFVCLGVTLGNAAYIALAIAGWAGIRDHPELYRWLEIAGALYLGWLGSRMLGAKPLPEDARSETAERLPGAAQLCLGLGSALLNPKNMVFYLAIMTTLVEAEAGMGQRIAAGVWMCGAVLLWDAFVAAAVSRAGARRLLWRRLHLMERACGAFLLFLGISVLVAPWLR